MYFKRNQIKKSRFSKFMIIVLLASIALFGFRESLFSTTLSGSNVVTPLLKTNNVFLEIPGTSVPNNYSFWFYYNALILSSINGTTVSATTIKKHVFAANWGTGDFYVYNNLGVGGTVTATSYACSSDLRFKTNITPFFSATQKIMSLQGVTYSWNTDKFKERNFSKARQIGFIAQDVENFIPELVITDEKGYKAIDYSKLSVVLVEAFKEQKKEIDLKISALEKENASLKLRLASLEKMSDRIANLEKKIEQASSVAMR